MKHTHLYFIFPKWKRLLDDYPELTESLSGSEVGTFKMAGLGIPTAAASLPPDCQISVVDDNIDAIDYEHEADIVCLSFFTPQATRAYQIADQFRAKGKTVIAGGIHPTMAPEDTLQHFDAVVRGPVEGIWPTLFSDFKDGQLQSIYQGCHDASFAQPNRSVFINSTYLKAGIVQTARGCGVGCPFCVVPRCYGDSYAYKDLESVVEDIKAMPYYCYYFADENLLFPDVKNQQYCHELLARIIQEGIRKVFFLAVYPFMLLSLSSKMIERLYQAGCRQMYVILGLKDPLSVECQNQALIDKMNELKDIGIEAMTTFTLGHDKDPVAIEPFIMTFCEQIRANLTEFTLWTPFPGTPTFENFKKEGRILHTIWEKYNGANVVFRPLSCTPEQLQQQYVSLWKDFYANISTFDMNQRYIKGFGSDIMKQ